MCCPAPAPVQVQPVVQPVVAAQPRPSLAYSYGYPSTGHNPPRWFPSPTNRLTFSFLPSLSLFFFVAVTYGLSLPTVSPTYTWGGYPGLYGAGFLGGKAGAYGDVNTASPAPVPVPVPPYAPYAPYPVAPMAPAYAPTMGMGLPGVGFGSYGGYGIGGYGGVKADGGFLMSAVKK